MELRDSSLRITPSPRNGRGVYCFSVSGLFVEEVWFIGEVDDM